MWANLAVCENFAYLCDTPALKRLSLPTAYFAKASLRALRRQGLVQTLQKRINQKNRPNEEDLGTSKQKGSKNRMVFAPKIKRGKQKRYLSPRHHRWVAREMKLTQTPTRSSVGFFRLSLRFWYVGDGALFGGMK